MDITQYIKAELLILIPVLYLLGMWIKRSNIKDKFIPFILGGFGVVLALFYILATSDIATAKDVFGGVFSAFTQGILCAAASTYVDQLIKQSNKKDE